MVFTENVDVQVEGTDLTQEENEKVQSLGDKLKNADKNNDNVLTSTEISTITGLTDDLKQKLNKITFISTENFNNITNVIPGEIFSNDELSKIAQNINNALNNFGTVAIIGLTDSSPSVKGDYTNEYKSISQNLQKLQNTHTFLNNINIPDFNSLTDGNAELRVIRAIQTLNQLVENGSINESNIGRLQIDWDSGFNQPKPGVSVSATKENKSSLTILTEEQKKESFTNTMSRLKNVNISYNHVNTTGKYVYAISELKGAYNGEINEGALSGLTAFSGGEYSNGVYSAEHIQKTIAETTIALKEGYITEEQLLQYMTNPESLKSSISIKTPSGDGVDINTTNIFRSGYDTYRYKVGDNPSFPINKDDKAESKKNYYLSKLYQNIKKGNIDINKIVNVNNNLGKEYQKKTV